MIYLDIKLGLEESEDLAIKLYHYYTPIMQLTDCFLLIITMALLMKNMREIAALDGFKNTFQSETKTLVIIGIVFTLSFIYRFFCDFFFAK